MWQHCHTSAHFSTLLQYNIFTSNSIHCCILQIIFSICIDDIAEASDLHNATRKVFSWHRMAAFTSYLYEASCTISIPSYITQTRRQISLRRQQYIAQMNVATTSAKHQICVDI